MAKSATSNQLIPAPSVPQNRFDGPVDPGFVWRARFKEFHYPRDMVTRHLFHTLRMIWNNFMPPYMRVGEVRLYDFDPKTHSRRYLGQAVLNIGRELMTRDDMTEKQKREFYQMRDWFAQWEDVEQPSVEATKKLPVAPGRLPR